MNCKNCGTTLVENSKFCFKCGKSVEEQSISNIEYYAISPARLILFGFLTCELYITYWFYKNFRKMGNSVILSIIKAILSPFFCYELSENVFKSAKSCGYTNFSSAGWITTAYALSWFIGILFSLGESSGLLIISIILTLIECFILTYIQKAINFNNKQLGFEIKNAFSDFSFGELVIVITGVVLFLFSLLILISTINADNETLINAGNETFFDNNETTNYLDDAGSQMLLGAGEAAIGLFTNDVSRFGDGASGLWEGFVRFLSE